MLHVFAHIRDDSYVNVVVYSGYGVCASILVTLQQCRKYLSQNMLVSKDFESFALGKFTPFPPLSRPVPLKCYYVTILLSFSVFCAERV